MSDNFDQQAAQSPAPSPNGSRQDGQSGGSAKSSASRNAMYKPPRNWASGARRTSLAEASSFMLQR
jgi:hypothetical protein